MVDHKFVYDSIIEACA